MGLTMGQRQAVTTAIATRYRRASKADKGRILDELCATTGWHRNHARKALGDALRPKVVRARRARPPTYGPEVVVALRFCWAVLGAPTGKRLAPVLPDLVARLRRFGELELDEATAALLAVMSAATIDRRLAADRASMALRGRSHTKPGSLLKDAIAIRTWAQWDDAVPGFIEIDLVGHEGGNAAGDHAYTLTVTDIATGWTENRSVPNKARKWVIAALSSWPAPSTRTTIAGDRPEHTRLTAQHRHIGQAVPTDRERDRQVESISKSCRSGTSGSSTHEDGVPIRSYAARLTVKSTSRPHQTPSPTRLR